MPLFRIERPEKASLWIEITDRDRTTEYIPFLGLSKNGGGFRKRTHQAPRSLSAQRCGSGGVERQWSHAPGELGRWHGGGVAGLGCAWITAWTLKQAYDDLA